MQLSLFDESLQCQMKPKKQLLKWVGNKQRFANEIIAYFPDSFNTYFEPFLGSGAVLGALEPEQAIASDVFGPLISIWQTLKDDAEKLKLFEREIFINCGRSMLKRFQMDGKTLKEEIVLDRLLLTY